jgi:RimJ/RimL family protein N-acetyltransferase
VSDVPALVAAFGDPAIAGVVPDNAMVGVAPGTPDVEAAVSYVARRQEQWEQERACSWAVCEPATGEMLAEVAVHSLDIPGGSGEIGCYTLAHARRRGVLSAALPAVLRFAFGGIGLHRITYRHSADNLASAALAQRCGFTREGVLRAASIVDGRRQDVVCWSRLATDR